MPSRGTNCGGTPYIRADSAIGGNSQQTIAHFFSMRNCDFRTFRPSLKKNRGISYFNRPISLNLPSLFRAMISYSASFLRKQSKKQSLSAKKGLFFFVCPRSDREFQSFAPPLFFFLRFTANTTATVTPAATIRQPTRIRIYPQIGI